ncbi:hypothetical protein JOD29_000172 [Lysinibacillus composti]|uniref:Uncharacterized protein n=1 Tax=Lysinibacillus composti TaxID=720633 RepID=A0A3N9UVI4_9BACI|nr:hypothetical protein [Lysinibacillus composti]MBM7606935.1 hypothetical protein [Lysinibacillus composti]RQW76462.1 hypothetical protein EBB45_02620 [Lysinibacillus composti]
MQNINWEMMTQFVFPEDLGIVEEVISVNIKPRWQQVETDESVRLVGIYHITAVVRFNPSHLPQYCEGTLIEHLEFDGNDGYFEYALPLEVDLPREKIAQLNKPELFVNDVNFFVYDGSSCTFKWETKCVYEEAESLFEHHPSEQLAYEQPVFTRLETVQNTESSTSSSNNNQAFELNNKTEFIDEQIEEYDNIDPSIDNSLEIDYTASSFGNETVEQILEPSVGNETVEQILEPSVVNETVEEILEPSVVNETVEETLEPSVVNEAVEETLEPSVVNETVEETLEPSVVNETVEETVEPSSVNETVEETLTPSFTTEEVEETLEPSFTNETIDENAEPSIAKDLDIQYTEPKLDQDIELEYTEPKLDQDIELEYIEPKLDQELEIQYTQPEREEELEIQFAESKQNHQHLFNYQAPVEYEQNHLLDIEYNEVKINQNDIVEIIDVKDYSSEGKATINVPSPYEQDDFFSDLSESYTLLDLRSNKVSEE